ncbi:MAG: GNAT family N-acetyltransferase [Anaerolineales bacterium]|nr:GNAT family N-acetyltransferase [Anaerolineales bacterium]
MANTYLRAATAADQPIIKRLIRQARLNPRSLHWERFIVAEAAGKVAGIGQIKTLRDGTRELASLAVGPDHQGTNIGSAIVWTLISMEAGTLYLRCAAHNETYYHRFGFRALAPAEMPPALRRFHRLISPLVWTINAITRGDERLVVMRR